MPTFWFFSLSVSMRSIVISGIAIHFVPMMVDRGMSLTTAGSLLGAVAFLSIIGRLGLAWLGDFVDKRYLLATTYGLLALTMLALSQVQGIAVTLGVLVVYAVVYGGSSVLPLSFQADLFGRKAFATIKGLVHMVQTGGTLVGPLLAGFVYDTSQSYFIALLAFAAAGFVAMLFILGAKTPRRVDANSSDLSS
jgi:cyanate permease